MIIIPECKAVLITPPRTGSTSLRRAVRERYPDAWTPYRHMEADGVPQGYEQWQRVGVFRAPLSRMWSLYHYCRGLLHSSSGIEAWRQRLFASCERSFEDWLLNNTTPFTHPYSDHGEFYPFYTIRHNLPETRKSLKLYLRPDLGVRVLLLSEVFRWLGLSHVHHNATGAAQVPKLSPAAERHMRTHLAWDLEQAAEMEAL